MDAAAAAAGTIKVEGGGYSQKSPYVGSGGYGFPHFFLLCTLLIFVLAGCFEAYQRYGNPEKKHKKKRHETIGGEYGAVGQQDDGDEEAPSILGDLRSVAGKGTGAVGGSVGNATGLTTRFFSITHKIAQNVAHDVQGVGGAVVSKAKSATDVQGHLDKVKNTLGQVKDATQKIAENVAHDAQDAAEAGYHKGLDAAKAGVDVQAHLEKAKQAAAAASSIAAAAAEDAKRGAEQAASSAKQAAEHAAESAKHAAADAANKAKAAGEAAVESAKHAAEDAANKAKAAGEAAVQADGDHFILVGRVEKASFEPRRDPLLYFRGKYRRLHFT